MPNKVVANRYSTMDPGVFKNKLFRYHLIAVRIFGFVVDDNVTYTYYHYIRCIIFCVSFFGASGMLLWRAVFGNIAISRANSILYTSSTISALNAFFQQRQMVRLLQYAHTDIKKMLKQNRPQEVEIFNKMCKYIHTVSLVVWGPAGLAILYILVEFIWKFIFKQQNVFIQGMNANDTSQAIILLRLWPFREVSTNILIGDVAPLYGLWLGGSFVPSWHTFMATLMVYVSIKLQIINLRIENMNEHVEDPEFIAHEGLKVVPGEDMQLQMIYSCIEEQIKIKVFLDDYESFLRLPMFLDFILSSILVSFTLYELTKSFDNFDFFFLLQYLFVMAFVHWVYYWNSNEIILCSEATARAAYFSNWYDLQLKTKKALLLFMTGSSRAMEIKSYLIPMNISSFLQIVKASYGYFNLMRSTS